MKKRVNPSLKAGERRLVQAGVEGLRRNLVEVDTEGNRSLKGTELIKETVTEIVEIGPKVDVQDDKPFAPAPVAQAAKQEPAKAEAQADKPEGKQLPSTGEGADANLLALGLVGVLGGFGLSLKRKKKSKLNSKLPSDKIIVLKGKSHFWLLPFCILRMFMLRFL